MSDWSYEHAPDYDRAASLYRRALAQPDLEDRGDVQDRLDDLAAEQRHPAKRKPSSKRDYNISNAERAWYKMREECVLGCLDRMPCLWEPRKGR